MELSTYTGYMFLIGEVKIVHFVLERVEDLSMPGHVSSQNQCDDRLQGERLSSYITTVQYIVHLLILNQAFKGFLIEFQMLETDAVMDQPDGSV